VPVAAAPLTITASGASTTFGVAPPAITPGYQGLVNGDRAPPDTATAGVVVTFSTALRSLCTATTDSRGAAKCARPILAVLQLTATAPVTAQHLGSTATTNGLLG
jgi:hypothetical protein